MHTGLKLALASLLGLAACGGSKAGGGAATNAFTGTITITGASPGGACGTNHTVTFTDGGVSPKAVTAAGGDCVTFTNADSANHQPGWRSQACETELTSPVLLPTQSHTTPVLSGPKTCDWEDVLNPPGGCPPGTICH